MTMFGFSKMKSFQTGRTVKYANVILYWDITHTVLNYFLRKRNIFYRLLSQCDQISILIFDIFSFTTGKSCPKT